MNTTIHRILSFLWALALSVVSTAQAQNMPQDNWRYDGIYLGSPTAGNRLACIGSGSGGIYIGEMVFGSTSPTKILRFSENGIFISRFSASFSHLLGITCDSAGNVYALDRGDSKVKVYSPTGNFLREWGGVGTADGKFTIPATFQASYNNMIAIAGESEVVVCDPGNSRVQVFNLNGTFIRKFGELGNLPGQFAAGHPAAVVASGDGMLWLSQAKRFKSTGEYHSGGPFDPYAVSKDGLYVGLVNQQNVPYNLQMRNFDSTASALLTSVAPGTAFNTNQVNGVTFSPSGYLFYLVGGTNVCYRCVREYSSAINFTNPTPLPQAEIISTSQRSGTNLVDVSYRVTDTDSSTVTTALLAFIDAHDRLPKVVPMKTFIEGTAGNVGSNQPVNTIRNVVWNMPADWAVTFSNLKIEVLAKDERNLMGMHWITIPATNDKPAIQVSHRPFGEGDLYPLWLWLVGTNQCTLTRTGAETSTIKGDSGIYGNIVLVNSNHNWNGSSTPGQQTTLNGRVFALSKMGARPISADELTRASTGSYGFASLDGNTIVKEAFTPATSAIQGYGNNTDNRASFQTFTSNNPVSIDAGMSHNLFIRTDGSLWGYGSNSFGELGVGDTTARSIPTKIADGVAKASAGSNMSAFIKTDGTLWVMGRNANGGLGDGTTTQRNSPVQITDGVANVSVGMLQTLFVKTNGTLFSAGRNNHGQLGDGTTTDRLSPVLITSGVTKVVAAGDFSFFIKTDGSLWAMGRNDFGQLGRGNTTATLVPVQVTTGVAAIEGSSEDEGFHSHMIKTDGSLWATGRNHNGQLGDGTTTNRNSFVPITEGVDKVVAGQFFSMFRKTNGTVWAHGSNGNGQLADGTTTNRTAPVQISSNVIDFSAGREHSLLVVPAAP